MLGQLDPGEDFFGIVSESPIRFFGIQNFYGLFPPCIDHDVFEGVFPSIVKFSLRYFTNKKFFTIRELEVFFNSLGLRNKDKTNFPTLKFDNIDQIRFIASESYTFSRFYLSFLEKVPEDDEVFIIIKLLIDMIKILMRLELDSEHLVILQNIVTSFLSECSKIPDIKMTIKFHHLTHYASRIERFGPPRTFSTINFESVHSMLKEKMVTSKNWKNVILTSLNKYARSCLVTGTSKAQELGAKEMSLPPIISNSFPPQTEFAMLSGLNLHRQYFRCGTTAIVHQNSLNNLTWIKLVHIFRANGIYYGYGTVYNSFEDGCNRIFLHSTQISTHVPILKTTIAHEIYSMNGNLFVVPYCELI